MQMMINGKSAKLPVHGNENKVFYTVDNIHTVKAGIKFQDLNYDLPV